MRSCYFKLSANSQGDLSETLKLSKEMLIMKSTLTHRQVLAIALTASFAPLAACGSSASR